MAHFFLWAKKKKLRAVFGEGGGALGTPQILGLDDSMRTKQDVIAMNDATFKHTLSEIGHTVLIIWRMQQTSKLFQSLLCN